MTIPSKPACKPLDYDSRQNKEFVSFDLPYPAVGCKIGIMIMMINLKNIDRLVLKKLASNVGDTELDAYREIFTNILLDVCADFS